jgi:hypothetical protein
MGHVGLLLAYLRAAKACVTQSRSVRIPINNIYSINSNKRYIYIAQALAPKRCRAASGAIAALSHECNTFSLGFRCNTFGLAFRCNTFGWVTPDLLTPYLNPKP